MLAMDREGMGHGEERLDPNFQAPRSLAGWHKASMSWEGVSTAPAQVLDYDQHDRLDYYWSNDVDYDQHDWFDHVDNHRPDHVDHHRSNNVDYD